MVSSNGVVSLERSLYRHEDRGKEIKTILMVEAKKRKERPSKRPDKNKSWTGFQSLMRADAHTIGKIINIVRSGNLSLLFASVSNVVSLLVFDETYCNHYNCLPHKVW